MIKINKDSFTVLETCKNKFLELKQSLDKDRVKCSPIYYIYNKEKEL